MADAVRTKAQLVALFPDNTAGAITAQDGRDLIVSAFGYVASVDPTVNDDNVDTSGIGQFFDTGSWWFDTSNARAWVCQFGTPGAAGWQALMYDGQAAGGMLGGFYPNPTVIGLPGSGVTPGTYGDSTHVGRFTVNAEGRITAASSITISAGTVSSVGLVVPGELSAAGSPVTSSGTITLTWATQTANYVFAGPTSGGAATPGFRLLVAADIPSLPGSKINSGGLNAGNVDTGTLPLGVIPVLTSAQLPTGSTIYGTAGAFPQVKKFTLTSADVRAAGAGVHQFTLATLLTLPSRAFVGRISWYIATAFSGTGITTIVLNLGFSGGAGGTSLDTFYLNSGAMNSVSARPTAVSNTQDCQNATATWQFTWGVNANVAANLSNCTAGSLDITVEYWQPT